LLPLVRSCLRVGIGVTHLFTISSCHLFLMYVHCTRNLINASPWEAQ
jgi:hypothetical protein